MLLKPLLFSLLVSSSSLSAATLIWDYNGTTAPNPQDGNGVWDAAGIPNWWDAANSTNVQWNNANGDTAAFDNIGTASSTVSLASAISAGGLTFTSVNTIAGGAGSHVFKANTFSLTGSSATIDTGANSSADFQTTTFNATNGFTKTGAGTLIIRAWGTVGNVQVNQGVLDVYGTSSIGNVTFSGGRFATHSSTNWGMASLTYNNTTSSEFSAFSGSSTYTIGAGGLTMGGGTLFVRADTTFTSKVVLKGDVTMTGSVATTAGISSSGTDTTSFRLLDLDAGTRTFSVATGSTFNVGITTQNGGLRKTGTGILRLSAANTYAAGTTIDEGILQLTATGTLGATTADLAVNTNGILDLGGTDQTIDSLDGAGTIYNNRTGAGTSTLTLGSNNGSGTFSGLVRDNTTGTGKVALIKTGTGTQTLSGNNTYTGGTTLNSGILNVTNSQVYTGSPTIGNGLGPGALTLNGGTLQLRANGANDNTVQTLTYSNATTITSDVTIDVNRESGTGTAKVLALGALNIGANTLTVTGGNKYVLRFNTVTLNDNATFNVTSTNAYLTINGAINGAGKSVTKTGAGQLTFTGGTFGDLIVNAGLADLYGTTTNANVTTTGTGTFTTHSGNSWTMNSLNYGSTGTSNFYAAGNSSTYTIGAGGLTMSSGALKLNNEPTTGEAIISKLVLQGNVNITGNSQIQDGGGNGQRQVDLAGGIRTFTVSNGATFTQNVLAQNGGITKEGAGTLALTAANTYTQGTTVNAGVLLANNTSGSATGTGQVVVTTATLAGTGTLGPTAGNKVFINDGGILSPGLLTGNTIGILTIQSDLTFIDDLGVAGSPSAILEIGGKTSGLFDRIVSTGIVTLDGTINVNFTGAFNGSTLALGDSFDLFDWASANHDNFNLDIDLLLPSLSAFGLSWDRSQFFSSGIISVIAIPEPSRALLLLVGAMVLSMRRKR